MVRGGMSRTDADGGYPGKKVGEPLAHRMGQWLGWVSGDFFSQGSVV